MMGNINGAAAALLLLDHEDRFQVIFPGLMQCHSYRLLLGVAPIGVWIYTLALYQEIVFLGRVFVNFVQEIQETATASQSSSHRPI
jgi:hypothetical protein